MANAASFRASVAALCFGFAYAAGCATIVNADFEVTPDLAAGGAGGAASTTGSETTNTGTGASGGESSSTGSGGAASSSTSSDAVSATASGSVTASATSGSGSTSGSTGTSTGSASASTSTGITGPSCKSTPDCPQYGECGSSICDPVLLVCVTTFTKKGEYCNKQSDDWDQCDGSGNCVECVTSGGCGECCTCDQKFQCVPA